MSTHDVILASTSPYRKQLLESIGVEFRTVAPGIDEQTHAGEPPRDVALRLASEKASAVAQTCPSSIVIGSDQTGSCNNRTLEKPEVFQRALEMLLSYRNQTVTFYTAVVVLSPNFSELHDVVSTEVDFRDFNREEAINYVNLDQPHDCVGAFKSEAHGSLLFASVRTEDPTALIGLPLIRTAAFLRTVGINPLLARS